jgi:hypothetical protein
MSNRTKDMSKDSTQNIPQQATKLKKLAKQQLGTWKWKNSKTQIIIWGISAIIVYIL